VAQGRPGTVPSAEAAQAVVEPVARERVAVLRLEDLGTPDEVYQGSVFRQIVSWALCLMCLGLAGCIGYGVLKQPLKSPAAGLSLIGMFTLAALACLYYALKLRELSYLVFPEALVEKRGSQTQIIPWDKIREIYQTVHPAWKNYRIVTRKGCGIEFTGNIHNYRTLGDRIEEKVLQILLPAALADVEQGKTLRLGPLTVRQSALQFDGRTSAWNQTTMSVGLNLEPDSLNRRSRLMHLHVYSPERSKAFKVELGKIPNFRLLIELVRHNWPHTLPPGF
jgi:hypothetical protein